MKFRSLLTISAALIVLGSIGFVPDASAQQVYAYGTTAPSSLSDSELYEINLANGTPTPIGTITGYGRVLAIDVEPVSQTIYGTGVRLSDMTSVLLTIDRTTGVGTEVGPIGMPLIFTGLSFRPNSTDLYAVGGTGGDLNLYMIDIVTGTASLVGDTGLEPDSARGNALSWGSTPISDLVVEHTGGVPANNPDLYTLHLGTGAATFSIDLTFPIGIAADAAFHSLDVNSLSDVYFGPYVEGSGAGSETRLGRLDATTGQVTDVGLIQAGLPIMEGFTLLIDNPPQVTVLSPNGGESYQPNTPVTITWNATDDFAVDHVNIGYFTGLKIYGSSTAGSATPSNFYEIDLVDGSATLIGPIGFDRVGAMDQHPGTGVIYAVGEIPATTVYVLLTIDPETGVGTQIGPTNLPVGGGISDLSFNRIGETLYGYRQVNSGDGSELYTFDLTTGEATLVERTGRMNAGGNALAFNLSGGLDFQSTMGSVPGAEFFAMNPYNADLTLLSSASFPPPYDVAGNQPRLAAMDYQPLSNNLFCIINDDVSPRAFGTANPGTGTVLVRGVTDPGLDGLVYAIDGCVTIAAMEPNDGVFEWMTPDTNLASVRIKITAVDASGNSRTDYSNTAFSVDGEPPTVSVIYPNNGEMLTPGNVEDILWTATDNVGVDHIDITYATGLTLFGSTTAGTVQPSDFYEINSSNGAASFIGAINFERVGAMDQHLGTGVIYAIGEQLSDNKKSLLTIDPASGAGSLIGLTGMPVGGGVSDVSFDPTSNILYAYHATSPSGSGLYRIDLSTGAATLIGNNGRTGTAGNAMGFSPGGSFYLQSTDGTAPGAQFFSLDKTTSAVSFLSNTSFPSPYDIAVNRPRMNAMDFQPLSSTPFCIINDDVAPYALGSFDPVSGNVLVRGTTTTGMDGLVYAFHPSFDIASGEPNDGTYSWVVPNTPSTQCRVRITAYDLAGNSRTSLETINFTIVDLVSAPPQENFVTFLGANAPNPFRDQTTIHFGLAKRGVINLSIYDARGRLIRTLFDGVHEPGTHTLTWNGANNAGSSVGSGLYLLRYRGEGFTESRSISLIR